MCEAWMSREGVEKAWLERLGEEGFAGEADEEGVAEVEDVGLSAEEGEV